MKIARFIVPYVLTLALGCTTAVPAPPSAVAGDPRLSAEEARADLEFLYRSLQSAHYNLYVHRPKAQYDASFQQVSSQLARPVSRIELVRELQPFVALGQIGHARIEFPVGDYVRALKEGGTILPFDIRIDGDRVFVTHSYLENSRIKPGVELLAFDERPIREVVDHVSRYVSGERPYMVHAQLERFFPRWLWVARGDIGELRVAARTTGEDRFVETIHGLPIGQVEPLKSKWTEALSRREVRFLDERIAYLRPGPFYNVEGGDSMDPGPFRTFIDDAFQKIQAARSPILIIDLRDNPGGDNSFSDLMVAWFASRPFRFSDDYSIKASPEIRRQFAKQVAESDDDGIVTQMHQALKDRKDGDIVPFELPRVSPRQDRFEGRVFLLLNRHSYSNAASVAGMVQDYGFAKVIGEETADLPTSYASSAQFTLPHSGLVVTYPKGYFVRPSGDKSLRGVVPDFPIPADVFLQGADAVLRAAVEIAASQ
ncbi:MAG TPA: S41 family peptidase [Thermoanaerobaculia bacterium]|nr:S41 family peptidase [Thermoanaerobaculia bacterium]